jgi:hypothetical protein
MTATLIQAGAAAVLLFALWRAFRFAMALRAQQVFREEARRAFEARGQRVVAEVPQASGELVLFIDEGEAFRWRELHLRKADITGARMLLNGAVMASESRDGAPLPVPPPAEEYEGRERWTVLIYMSGSTVEIPCGTVREGVSREVARRVYDAVRAPVTRITGAIEST